jgi:lipid II isoglutaminyl synthase (glutamine-hydrolysing)
MKPILTILHIYPKDMNIYGDEGNLLVLKRRAEWYGYQPNIIRYNPGDAFPKEVDIVLGGGGQDSGQDKIHADLLKIGPKLQALADNDVPMLVVCGLYQLFGHYFQTSKNQKLEGIGILDVTTIGLAERLIGNIITESHDFGDIIGYENHSGQTFLGPKAEPLATVRIGAGNNMKDETEGARYKNVIGTYLHGSLLPKNPLIADFMLRTAAIKKFGDFSSDVIDDSFAEHARLAAAKRPR